MRERRQRVSRRRPSGGIGLTSLRRPGRFTPRIRPIGYSIGGARPRRRCPGRGARCWPTAPALATLAHAVERSLLGEHAVPSSRVMDLKVPWRQKPYKKGEFEDSLPIAHLVGDGTVQVQSLDRGMEARGDVAQRIGAEPNESTIELRDQLRQGHTGRFRRAGRPAPRGEWLRAVHAGSFVRSGCAPGFSRSSTQLGAELSRAFSTRPVSWTSSVACRRTSETRPNPGGGNGERCR